MLTLLGTLVFSLHNKVSHRRSLGAEPEDPTHLHAFHLLVAPVAPQKIVGIRTKGNLLSGEELHCLDSCRELSSVMGLAKA